MSGASFSGSVMVVNWEALVAEISKTELASGEIDLWAVVGCEAGGLSSCRVVSLDVAAAELLGESRARERDIDKPHLRPQ